MQRIALFVFWITMAFYLVTLFNASYIGVYLQYICIPVIVISGLCAFFIKVK